MTTPIVHLIAAARPNFMKVAPVYHALKAEPWCQLRIIHTGQHYDANMSSAFFDDLAMPAPNHHLGVGSGSHAEQTAAVMVAHEKLCVAERPAWVIVVGDVNSTLACALNAAKLCIPVAHLEAGLRSGDRTMPEEINRIVTDAVADLLWTPSPDADENLRAEGVPAERIERVGNVMIDAYEMQRPRIEAAAARTGFGLDRRGYAVATFHRPANVDDKDTLQLIVEQLAATARRLPVVFPVHPRTRARIDGFGLAPLVEAAPGLLTTGPLGYIQFLSLVSEARLIITDSGGVQEETTYLQIPCLTVRTTTERPITITEGTNRLCQPADLGRLIDQVLAGAWPNGSRPELWDGHAAGRVAASLRSRLVPSKHPA